MGTDEWQEVSRRKRYNNTKEDDLIKISISIYVTNFPESFLAKDLFHACSKYGHVVDSFIPWKKSKEGKRFGFVRFINVFSVDRLVGNLCTIWIGRNKLEANIARFERAKGTNRNSNVSSKDVRPAAAAKVMGRNGSYNISVQKRESFASVLNSKPNGSVRTWRQEWSPHSLKAIESIQNLRNILYNEGFPKEGSFPLTYGQRKPSVDWEKWGIIQGNRSLNKESRSLDVLDDMVRVGHAMGYELEGCTKDIERLGHKSKKEWLKELILKHKVNFLAIQETKLDHVNQMAVKYLWGNSNYSYVSSDSLGNSGVLFIVIYAPQQLSAKNLLWDYVSSLINNWSGEAIVMGDFNEGDAMRKGYKFTWSHPSASKMSKLDRFLVTEGLLVNFPSLAAECLDRHLSDHRPILLHEVVTDFGPTPFRLYHSWFSLTGFDDMVEKAWRSFSYTDSNAMVRFKKMLQELKSLIRAWVKERKADQSGSRNIIVKELGDIDKLLDDGLVDDELLLKRMDLTRQLHEMNNMASRDARQKSKIKWAIEGDENSRYFHGIINKKRSQLAIRGVFNNGIWYTEPAIVKDIFKNHFQTRFDQPQQPRFKINFQFDKCLSVDQVMDLDSMISREEIRRAVWSCGVDKSPGPDGFSFEFFRKYWSFIGTDFCGAVEHFFSKGNFSRGCNSSFIALIPKTSDAKYVSDYRPISLIGSVYKVVTKILATRLAPIIPDIISDTQSAFLAKRNILDGPFILNELLSWCKKYNKQAMFFKVDFAKAFDCVRWDYLLDVMKSFGFGPNWCRWIQGTLSSARASVLVNGSPTDEFSFYRGLKQGDPLSPFLFILIMESLHLSMIRASSNGLFRGLCLNGSLSVSHLFYADDAMFIGEWSQANLENVIKMLQCFQAASGLSINIQKSNLLGVGVGRSEIDQAADNIGVVNGIIGSDTLELWWEI
ncbi:RNA-directed DNA polymerase, eukaryota [Tanacetum coccineum]